MAFGVLTGSAMATISAIGKIMAPEMEKYHYPKEYTSAMLASTSFLGDSDPPLRTRHYVCAVRRSEDF